jgi:hypothetical protein
MSVAITRNKFIGALRSIGEAIAVAERFAENVIAEPGVSS